MLYRRMKLKAAILQALLLKVVCQQEEICRKEELPVYYYIYNANVNITIYPCIVNGISLLDVCKMYNYTKIANISNHIDIVDECITNSFAAGSVYRKGSNIYNACNDKQISLALCDLPASAKLLSNTVELRSGARLYTNGRLHDNKNEYFLFWRTDPCRDLNLIHHGFFDVWTLQNGMKYIHNKEISVKLNKQISFCGSKLWSTNYDGIIASKNHIKTALNINLTQELQTTFDDCHGRLNITEESTGGVLTDSTSKVPESQKVTETNSDINSIMQYIIYMAIVFTLWYIFKLISIFLLCGHLDDF